MSHNSPSYSITMRLRYRSKTCHLGLITAAIGALDGSIGAIDLVEVQKDRTVRDITVSTSSVEHGAQIVARMKELPEVEVVQVSDRTFLLHIGGKIEVHSKVALKTRDDLSMAYTPGVARICQAIHADPRTADTLTIRRNMVAVITDGSAVLGLGNIGPKAALPVMEGKALLFKEFAGVDAFPICLDTQDTDQIIQTVQYLAPTFGGINLEDISSPRCMEIEERLATSLDIPVFHDDQHGTAVVVLAALGNALRIVQKSMAEILVVINGAGAAGSAIAKLLAAVGVRRQIVCDRAGAVYAGRPQEMNSAKSWLAENTNQEHRSGRLSEVLTGADVFIGVSAPNTLHVADLQRMARDPIVFALANPDPEILPEQAAGHVRVMATGRSDYPNQINNVLCFPGLFRGLLDVRAKRVTTEMKIAAARAIGDLITADELSEDYIVPSVFDRRVAKVVAEAVSEAAIQQGVAGRHIKVQQLGAVENERSSGGAP
ncbi:MAG: NAD-dependent malic enzyme [Planctomycetota bacterium]